MRRVVLYGTADCSLCDAMHAVVERVRRDQPFALVVVDVADDPELQRRHGAELPVLEIDGRKAFKYRVDERALRRRLARPG